MLDLERVCKDYGIPFLTEGHHHCHQGWIQLHCPICSSGRSGWHLGWRVEGGGFNCWRCGPLKFWDVLPLLLGRPLEDTRQLLRPYYDKRQPVAKAKSRPRRSAVKTPPGLIPLQSVHKRYLKGRGFRPNALAAEWQLQATCVASQGWGWRIIAPVFTRDGKLVAYCGRSIGTARPKYKMTDNADMPVPADELVYGIHKVPGDSVIIVEGPADVWRLGPGAVATLGIDWKRPQLYLLRKYSRRFVAFDPEPKAQQRARQLAEALSLFPGTTEIITGLASDPGGLQQKEADRLIRALNIRDLG